MTLKECYDALGGNYEDTVRRLYNEKLVEKFLFKFEEDPSFENLKKALEEENLEAAFRAAHTLKGVAQNIVYGAFDSIAEETGKDALEVFTEAMNNIMPALEVKARRIGGATYQVPIDVRPDRRQALALR